MGSNKKYRDMQAIAVGDGNVEETIAGIIPETNIVKTNEIITCENNFLEEQNRMSLELKDNYSHNEALSTFTRNNLINELDKLLLTKGFVFIEGTLLTGKSALLKDFNENKLKSSGGKKHLNNLGSELIIDSDENIENIVKLYAAWLRTILNSLIKDNFLIIDDNSKKYRNMVLHNSVIEKKLRNSDEDSILLAMIDILKDYKSRYNCEDILYLVIHLDNFQDHVDNVLYDELEGDLLRSNLFDNYGRNNYFNEIKIIVSTKYFHNKEPDVLTVKVVAFDKEELNKYVMEFFNGTNLEEPLLGIITELILDNTSGHPWFVNRFFHICSQLIIDKKQANNTINIIDMINEIFKDPEYWLNDSVFGYKNRSLFVNKATKIIQKKADTKFNQFLHENNVQNLSSNGYEKNIVIKELGLMKKEIHREYSFGNKIMQNFFFDKFKR